MSSTQQDNIVAVTPKKAKTLKPVAPDEIMDNVSSDHMSRPSFRQSPSASWRFLSLFMRGVTPLVILAAAFEGYSYLKNSKPEIPKKQRAEKVWPVQTQKVIIKDMRPTLRVFGETLTGRKVDLRSLVAGKVLKVGDNLREGAVVQKGEFLLEIDPFTYEGALVEARSAMLEARARLSEIKAAIESDKDAKRRSIEQLAIAEKDFNRAAQLSARGTVTKKLVDDRRLIVSQRRQAVEQFKNSLIVQQARLEQQQAILSRLEWRLRQARRNLKDTRLTAPYKAYVSNVGTNIGQVIGANDKVATLLDKDWIEVKFVLSDRQYGRMVKDANLVGKKAVVIWNVGENPLHYQAVIKRVGAQVNSENGGVEVFARLLDPNKAGSIRSGAFVEVILQDNLYKNVVRLPQTSVYDRKTVYVIEEGRLKSRPVKVLSVVGGDFLVRGKLKNGDIVATNKLSFAGDGVKVKEVSSL